MYTWPQKKVKIITANQPRFLPYIPYIGYALSGDVFDVGVYDPMTVKYHHRVLVGTDISNKWLRVPLQGSATKLAGKPFSEIFVNRDKLPNLQDRVVTEFKDSKFWRENKDALLSIITVPGETLADYLFNSMSFLFNYLEISGNMYYGLPPDPSAVNVTSRIASQLQVHCSGKDTIYLAGVASKSYLDVKEYERLTGQQVRYYTPKRISGLEGYETVSVASVLTHFGKKKTLEFINEAVYDVFHEVP